MTENTLKRFVHVHQLATFFVLACFLSLFALLFPFGDDLQKAMDETGGSSNTSLVYALQVVLHAPEVWLSILGMIYHPFTPTIAALIVVGIIGGWPLIRELLARLRPWQPGIVPRSALKWWLIAMLTMIAIQIAIALIRYVAMDASQFHWAPGQFGWLPIWAWFLAGLMTDGGAIGEELGWRGYGSSLLQGRYGPLRGAVVLGVMWSVWHFPARLPEIVEEPLPWIYYHIIFTIGCVALTIIMLFFSNKLGGTALIGVLIHSQSNDSFGLSGSLKDINSYADLGYAMTAFNEVPVCIAAAIIFYVSKGQLGFDAQAPGRRIWQGK